MCLMPYANNKGADQPAHPRSLISAFVVRCQDRMVPLVCISEISRFQLVSVAEQVSLCLAWSETPEDTFCHDEAHIFFLFFYRYHNHTCVCTGFAASDPVLLVSPVCGKELKLTDKTKKVTVRPAKTQISLGIRPG